MSFDTGNLGNFHVPHIPNPESRAIQNQIANLGEPPRDIELPDDHEEIVEKAKETLSYVNVTKESIFTVFNEWQSNKTKSLKRFVLSFSFILSMSLVAGINITEIDLFGVKVHEGMETIFLVVLIIILFIAFAYYEYLLRHDLKIHNAKIKSVKDALDECSDLVIKLDEIVEENSNIISVEVLLRDFWGMHDKGDDLKSYEAINFYNKELKNPEENYDLIELLEAVGIYTLGFIALWAIILSF